MPQNIRDALMGCLEIPLFLKAGTTRFANTKPAVILSFIAAVLVIFPSAYLARANPDFAGDGYLLIFVRFLMEYLIFCFLYLPSMHFIAKQLERDQYFLSFVNGLNWLNVSQLLMILPFTWGVIVGHWQWQEVYYFLVFLIMYGYAFVAFYITWVFRINWMLGAALSILGLALGELAHFFVYQ